MSLSSGHPNTLGGYRDLSVILFGERSDAVKFLDEKIAEQGRDSEVIQAESQMIYLLAQISTQHRKTALPDTTNRNQRGGDH